MKSDLELSCSETSNRSRNTRREFLKTSLVSSVAAATVGVAAKAEGGAAQTGAKAIHSSIISVTQATSSIPFRKPWKNTIATGRASLHLRNDLQQHLSILQREIGYRYCRFHGIFHDEMAVVARRKDGSLAFRWAQVDKAIDSLRDLGLRPHVELSSMPVALASGSETVFDWGFNTTPPRDFSEWGQLVGAFARHCVDRYGLDEVAQWYFEVWNEPNINFWSGTQSDYWTLYDVSAFALKAVSPRLRVGGPVSARAAWIPEFLKHCSTQKVPVDFISTHIYLQDEWVEYPGLRGTPHKPGMYASDAVRRVRETVRASATPDLEVLFTEWNSLVPLPNGEIAWNNNPSLEETSAAATVCDLAVAVDGNCETFCWWEASDVFGEGGMPQSEFSGTYGLLTLNGIRKSTCNAFRFLSRLRGARLEVRLEQPLAPGCNLAGAVEGESVRVLLWHRDLSAYGLKEQRAWTATLQMPWTQTAKPLLLQERITAGAGSSYETWQSLGTPQNLSPLEHQMLETHAAPEASVFHPDVANNQVAHQFRLALGEVLYVELCPRDAAALPTTPLKHELEDWYSARRGKKESSGSQ